VQNTSKFQQHLPESLCYHQGAVGLAVAQHLAVEGQEWLHDQKPGWPGQHMHTLVQLGLHLSAVIDVRKRDVIYSVIYVPELCISKQLS